MTITFQTSTTQGILEKMYTYVLNRNFDTAEKQLVEYLENIMLQEYNTDDDARNTLQEVKNIYFSFSEYYLDWVKKQGKSVEKEIEELQNDMHDNYLFAHVSDPESMDDLVFSIYEYLKHSEDDWQHDEASHNLEFYNRSLSQ